MGTGLTQQVLGRSRHCMGVEGREDPTLARAHVKATEPEVILLGLHKHWVVHIQLQLIRVAGDEPEVRSDVGSQWGGQAWLGCVPQCPVTSAD